MKANKLLIPVDLVKRDKKNKIKTEHSREPAPFQQATPWLWHEEPSETQSTLQ